MEVRFLLAGAMISVILASCSARLTPFTQDMYEKERWTESELKKIQFYLSEDIILSRQMVKGESQITAGKIRIENGRRIEEIRIPTRTPGVLLFIPRQNRFAVSFEENDDDLYLMFGPNPKMRNRYALLAREWEGDQGRIHYNGRLYDVDSRSAFASLMVDLKKTGTTEYNSRRAEGRRVE